MIRTLALLLLAMVHAAVSETSTRGAAATSALALLVALTRRDDAAPAWFCLSCVCADLLAVQRSLEWVTLYSTVVLCGVVVRDVTLRY